MRGRAAARPVKTVKLPSRARTPRGAERLELGAKLRAARAGRLDLGEDGLRRRGLRTGLAAQQLAAAAREPRELLGRESTVVRVERRADPEVHLAAEARDELAQKERGAKPRMQEPRRVEDGPVAAVAPRGHDPGVRLLRKAEGNHRPWRIGGRPAPPGDRAHLARGEHDQQVSVAKPRERVAQRGRIRARRVGATEGVDEDAVIGHERKPAQDPVREHLDIAPPPEREGDEGDRIGAAEWMVRAEDGASARRDLREFTRIDHGTHARRLEHHFAERTVGRESSFDSLRRRLDTGKSEQPLDGAERWLREAAREASRWSGKSDGRPWQGPSTHGTIVPAPAAFATGSRDQSAN